MLFHKMLELQQSYEQRLRHTKHASHGHSLTVRHLETLSGQG